MHRARLLTGQRAVNRRREWSLAAAVAASLLVLGALPLSAEGGTGSRVLAHTGSNPVAIVTDADGNVYTANSGSDNVSVVTRAGVSRILGETGSQPVAITIGADGSIYTANFGSDDVTRISPDGASRRLGSTAGAPFAIAVDGAGNVFTVARPRIAAGLTLDVTEVSQLTPDGTLTIYSGARGDAWVGLHVSAIATDHAGNLLLADHDLDEVVERSPTGAVRLRGRTGRDPSAMTVLRDGTVLTVNADSLDVTRIAPDGTSSTYRSSGTSGISAGEAAAIAGDALGNAYVATGSGVTKLTPARCGGGIEEVISRTPASAVAIDGAGRVYTAQSATDTVTKVAVRGSIVANTGSGPVGLALDASGNLYTANERSDDVTRIAPPRRGCFASAVLGPTGSAPFALAVDPTGNVYTSNGGTNDVTKLTPAGVSTRLGYTALGPSGCFTDADGYVRCLHVFGGIAVDRAGTVYASNYVFGNNVSKITATGLTSLLGGPTIITAGSSSDTGPGPLGIAVAADGTVYVANAFTSDVTKITPTGLTSVLGQTGAGPTAIALDAAGNVYTANGSGTVSRLTPDGVSRILGSTGAGPSAISLDAAGNVYTANTADDTVSQLTPSGTSTIIGRTGHEPAGIVVTPTGAIFTSNRADSTVTQVFRRPPRTQQHVLLVHGLSELGEALALVVDVPGAGATSFAVTTTSTLSAAASRRAVASASTSVCASSTVRSARASRITVTCRLRPAVISHLLRRSLLATVTTTFTPTYGTVQSATSTIELRHRPAPAEVSSAIETTMHFAGPGTALQTGTVRHSGHLSTVCVGSKRITTAGLATLRCLLTPEAIELSRSLPLRVSIRTVFAPDDGTKQTRHERIDLAETDLPVRGPNRATGGVTG